MAENCILTESLANGLQSRLAKAEGLRKKPRGEIQGRDTSQGQTSQASACRAKEFVNNGEPLTVLVSSGEQTLRPDGINVGANALCS